ncbi:MAG: hypothetical protein ACXQTN_05205, partial [Methanoculleaceae archaeon]
ITGRAETPIRWTLRRSKRRSGRIFERGMGEKTGPGLFLCREVLSITGIAIEETDESGRAARFPPGAWHAGCDG